MSYLEIQILNKAESSFYKELKSKEVKQKTQRPKGLQL